MKFCPSAQNLVANILRKKEIKMCLLRMWKFKFSRTIRLSRPVTIRKIELVYIQFFIMITKLKLVCKLQVRQRNFLDDVLMTVTWPGDNLQARYKMRTWLGISGSPSTASFKLRQNCRYDAKIHDIILTARGLHETYRPGTEWGPD